MDCRKGWLKPFLIIALLVCGGWRIGSDQGFRDIKIGAGGFSTGIDIAADGTKVVRNDTNGAYYWTGAQWTELVTRSSMPAGDLTSPYTANGVWEIAIAPSNTLRFYMEYNGFIYRTDNRGGSWLKTNYTQDTGADAFASNARLSGQKLAIDPANPDVVYVGNTSTGIWRTLDAGQTWTNITAIMAPSGAPGAAGIVFDANSGTTTLSGVTVTKTVYLPSYGKGIWITTDGGSTFTQIADGSVLGGPTLAWHAQIASDGSAYYVVDQTHAFQYATANHGASGTWTQFNTGSLTPTAVATSPSSPGRFVLMFGQGGTSLGESLTAGSTWVNGNGANTAWSSSFPGPGIQRAGTDVPWLVNESAGGFAGFMTSSDFKFDPTSGDLYLAQGFGVWHTTFPTTFAGFNWTSQSAGMEQLVPNVVSVPPGGSPVFGTADQGTWYNLNTASYATSHGPNFTTTLTSAWSLPYSAGTPSFVACLCNAVGAGGHEQSGYSTDGGKTWTAFATVPPNTSSLYGGSLAINSNDSTNLVWIQSNNGKMYQTINQGVSWTNINPPGVPTSGTIGWDISYFNLRKAIAADKVDADTFYAYNYIVPGLFISTDKGATWSLKFSGHITSNDAFGGGIVTVPGKSGHLFWYTGKLGGTNQGVTSPTSGAFLKHSEDHGATWDSCPGVLEITGLAFGKPRSGGYPAIYISGWSTPGNVYGIYRSEDECQTWTLLGTAPLPSSYLQLWAVLGASQDNFGQFYGGLGYGAGFFSGQFNYLLNRDLHHDNDNSPAFLNHVA